jgi:molybdenum cofactor cytidylyltransferase
MKFGAVQPATALGAVLAHSLTVAGRRLRKGQVLTASDIETIVASGVEQVTVARLEPGDVTEDAAALRLAQALVPDPAALGLSLSKPFTGRVNLLSDGPGVVILDVAALEALNAVDPMITLATVAPFHQMANGGMVATIKIISYAVPETALLRACELARGAIRLARPVLRTADLIVTEIPGGAGDKGRTAIAARLDALGVDLRKVMQIPHSETALAQALGQSNADLSLILTGSATSDINDVAPAALRLAGGEVLRFGMPVDPGNLLFLGELADRPVIGLPGCARSPALNGADWVLSRVVCGLPVTSADIAAMGVGGLLKEIPTRPQPRRGA